MFSTKHFKINENSCSQKDVLSMSPGLQKLSDKYAMRFAQKRMKSGLGIRKYGGFSI